MPESQLENLLIAASRLDEKVDGINRRLDISNGRLAKAENSVSELQKSDILINGALTALGAAEATRSQASREFRKIWLERGIWFLTLVFLTILLRTGILNITI